MHTGSNAIMQISWAVYVWPICANESSYPPLLLAAKEDHDCSLYTGLQQPKSRAQSLVPQRRPTFKLLIDMHKLRDERAKVVTANCIWLFATKVSLLIRLVVAIWVRLG